MAEKTRNELKAFFETGDLPTEQEFADFIDSVPNIETDGLGAWQSVSVLYSDFQPNASSVGLFDVFSVPAGYQVSGLFGVLVSAFSGAPIAELILSMIIKGTLGFFNGAKIPNAVTLGTDKGFFTQGSSEGAVINVSSGGIAQVKIQTIFGGTVDSLSSGEITLYYKLDKLLI